MRHSRYIYVTPWCRAGPWAVGLWTGYALFKHNQKKIHLKYWLVVGGWTLAVFLALSVMFGMWGFSDYEHPMEYTVMTQFFHGGFARTTWALAVAWVVFACHTGNGGVVNSFLSYPAWQPLSRLTYTMYLMSLELQEVIASSLKTTVHLNHTNKILETCGCLLVTGIAAILLSLGVESPIIGLEKLILRK